MATQEYEFGSVESTAALLATLAAEREIPPCSTGFFRLTDLGEFEWLRALCFTKGALIEYDVYPLRGSGSTAGTSSSRS